MKPYLSDSDFTLYCGDAIDVLKDLPDESVHCVVTSPPYWGLRDYGTGVWEGGDPECDHATNAPKIRPPTNYNADFNERWGQGSGSRKQERLSQEGIPGRECVCGALRIDQQIGLERSVSEYVDRLVSVFAELRRVVRKDGNLFVNIGDARSVDRQWLGIPHRLTFAMQADGWRWEDEIIWSKPNAMPSSADNRTTRAHEVVMVFNRSRKAFYDADAIRETAMWQRWSSKQTTPKHSNNGNDRYASLGREWTEEELERYRQAGRNARSVWEIVTASYPDAHFAVFPEALVEPCIKAGTSERGCCPECGAPWERETERGEELEQRPSWRGESNAYGVTGGNHRGRTGNWGAERRTLEWRPSCNCQTISQTTTSSSASSAERSGTLRTATDETTFSSAKSSSAQSASPATTPEPVPCTVMDPFLGSGTTALVARRLGRHMLGIELNEDYCAMIAKRTQQLSLLA